MEKLTEYRPIRQSLHSVRLVLLVVLLASSLFITSQAFAVPDITNSSAKRHDQAVYQTQLMVIYVPNLKWDSLDPDECPTLYELAETSAIANMSAPWNGLAESIAADESIELHLLDPGLGLAECDEIVAMLLEEAGNEKVVIIVSAAVFSDSPATHELTPTIIKGNGFSGLVISESTKRVGLIYGEDLLTFNRYLASLKENLDPKAPVEGEGDQAGSPFGDAAGPIFTCDFSSKTIDDRIDQLENNTTTIDSIIQTKPTINMVYMVFVYIAFALSTIVLLKMNKTENKQPGQAGLLVPLVRALWIIALSYPPASFLMFLTIPVNPSPSQMMVICGIWVVVIASIALVIGYRKHWLASLVFLFAASIAVIAIGQVFGGPLHEPGYLTYDITDGSRFYGMGNEQAAIFFGSWFTLSGLIVNYYGDSPKTSAFKKWGFLLGTAILLFIAASPWFGASFGPLVWVSFGALAMWWLLNGKKARWWHVLAALGISALLATSILSIDLLLNPYSHMVKYREALGEGLFGMLAQVMKSSWQASYILISDYMPVPVVLCFLSIIAFLVYLGVKKPGGFSGFWNRNQAFGAVYITSFMVALVMLLIEDSGFFTPAVFMIFVISGFVWLVCDRGLGDAINASA